MKKFIILIFLLILTSCTPKQTENDITLIPAKINPMGFDVESSSINTINLDSYLNREDVFYCDLRYYSWVLKDGYINGFSFIPYYEFISTRSGNNAYFKQEAKNGIKDGEVGSFTPLYKESEMMLKKLFPKDKTIFLVSQSGLESYYMTCLLAQYEYDVSKIYNVGGVSATFTNLPAYRSVGKNFIKGNPSMNTDVTGEMFKVDFSKLGVTPIKE